MKSIVLLLSFLLFIFLLFTTPKAEPGNSKISETFFSLTSCEELQGFWNLHSEELKNETGREEEVQKVVLFAFFELVERDEVPGYTPETLKYFGNLTLYRFTDRVNSLKSEDPIFSKVIDDMSGCDSSFIIEISSQDSGLKYLICFSPQGEIEIRSAYIFEQGHWNKFR